MAVIIRSANSLVGIDEVGRGCWAGPLVAAAVVLDNNSIVSHDRAWKLGDSKVLTKLQRKRAAIGVQNTALAIGLGWASPGEIDSWGLTGAVRVAMQRALNQVRIPYDHIIIDGNYNFMPENPKVSTLVRADSLVPAVSAASIIAKVARDNYMTEAARKYKEYGFEKHVGYGTRLHREKLHLHGVCELHRISFMPVSAIIEGLAP